MSDHYKNNLMKNKCYVLFSGLTITYVTNELKHPFGIVDK